MRFYKLQQLTINVYQHSLPLKMANTWIKTKLHLTPLPQGSSLTIKCKEWSSNRGVIYWWHLLHHNVQCLYCILRYFAILFSTQKVVKFQKTEVLSKLNFNLVGKIRISINTFLSISMSTSTILAEIYLMTKWCTINMLVWTWIFSHFFLSMATLVWR